MLRVCGIGYEFACLYVTARMRATNHVRACCVTVVASNKGRLVF